MGLFVLPMGKTPEDNVREAIANLNIWLEYYQPGRDPRYLFSMARGCLDEAEKKIEEGVDAKSD